SLVSGASEPVARPAIRATVDAVATSYRKKAKAPGNGASASPALPRKTRGGRVDPTPEPESQVLVAMAGAAGPAGGGGNAGFKLVSPYQPGGDQPKAIGEMVDGLRRGDEAQVLLGITGSGKTFSIANVIATVDRPTLIIAHNKILAAQL